MDFGEKLKALRTERGLTQEQLAARLYVSRTAVSKWETGGGSPNLDSLQAVARLFDVSVDDLLSTDDLIVLAVMAAAVVSLMFVGAVEIVLAAAGSRRAARIVALVGFAVQALAVVLFASTMQPYATTLMFVLLLAKVVVGYRILRS